MKKYILSPVLFLASCSQASLNAGAYGIGKIIGWAVIIGIIYLIIKPFIQKGKKND
jgi:nitrate reductase gamma subunit